MGVVADRVNIEVFSLALAHFAQAVSAGSDRHVVLVAGPSPGGRKVGKSSCRRASISSFCHPTRWSSSKGKVELFGEPFLQIFLPAFRFPGQRIIEEGRMPVHNPLTHRHLGPFGNGSLWQFPIRERFS
jgi:hypothetical protein